MAEKPKKSVFGKIADAMSNRDEIEAAELAKKEADVARREAAEAKAELEKMKSDEAKEKAARYEAQKKAAVDRIQKGSQDLKEAAEDKAALHEAQRKAAVERIQRGSQELKEKAVEMAKPEPIKHVWTREDTYASLAMKHYGSMKEPYWRLIYNHNKDIIGNHPNDIRLGLEIEIPPLPDEMKIKK